MAFNVDRFLHRMLANAAPHVERIYVAHSEFPWSYNTEAADSFRNETTVDSILASAYRDKIEVISGRWSSEEAQRNACVDRARADGFDYLIVQDADEYLLHDEYDKAIRDISGRPDYDLYRINWLNFWKSSRYVLEDKRGSRITGTPEFAINLGRGVRFVDRRKTNAETELLLDAKCFHLEYVGSDEDIYAKVNTWGHAHEFDSERWYREKWSNWVERSRYLHPVRPLNWRRAAFYDGPLPDEIADWPEIDISVGSETFPRTLGRRILEVRTLVRGTYQEWKRRLIRRVKNLRGTRISILATGLLVALSLPVEAEPVKLSLAASLSNHEVFLTGGDSAQPSNFHTFSGWNRPLHDGLVGYGPYLLTTVNSGYPQGHNDRSVWQSKGVTQFLTGGVSFHTSFLDVYFLPEFWWTQNAHYRIGPARSGDPTYGNYWWGLDQPQRFGSDPIAEVHPGQSSLTVYRWNTAVSLGTQNITLGPGSRNNLILSDNAPGFPHASLGSYDPWHGSFGTLEWKFFWGRFRESDFFDTDSSNDHRLVTGAAVAYAFPFLPNLTVGLNRMILSPWEEAGAYEAFQMFETFWKAVRPRDDTEDNTDQVVSLVGELRFPDQGFRLYLEWGRNDHAATPYDLIMNPEHTRAYVTGFDYLVPLTSRDSLRFSGEITVINPTPTRDVRGAAPWYRHGAVAHGHTNQGQYTGAWIGTGANSQYAAVDWYRDDNVLGGYVERTVYDNDFFYTLPDQSFYDFNMEIGGGVRASRGFGFGRLEAEAGATYGYNRFWIQDEDLLNLNLQLGYTYQW